MNDETLISIDDLVKKAKKSGVLFGKTDPYNRLRYYTKISLLPHMERRKTKSGILKAYYPLSALDRLIKIELLKEKGMSNEEIILEFEKEEKSIKKTFKNLVNKKSALGAAVALTVLVAFLNSKGVINLGKEASQSVYDPYTNTDIFIVDSGTGVVKAGRIKTFVQSNKTKEDSEVQIAFKDSFFPATNYVIETKVPGEGFVLELDNHTAADSEFSWWIKQK